MSEAGTASQAALMDGIYRGQRHIYDLTRKYYLFGRDGLIEQLAASDGATVIEIACGTGRNLGAIKRRWPGTACLLYTSPSPRDKRQSRMPSSA